MLPQKGPSTLYFIGEERSMLLNKIFAHSDEPFYSYAILLPKANGYIYPNATYSLARLTLREHNPNILFEDEVNNEHFSNIFEQEIVDRWMVQIKGIPIRSMMLKFMGNPSHIT